ncbi:MULTISPECIES: hypothetical protein [Bacillus]|uniref:Uncharacterized protein n=2 Tax=Bacillus TaxID=1386 RepID=A0A0M4G8Y3_9BACI|nr:MULTISPECIES: hypothetical protein [Bacillus]ALC81745.1 hypothetical protein AM592_09090 [Bacillus gobiensis]MBP1080825.1 hypothetical protein [Bacillus capparidis]MED1097469.1 hypothetical protein [Bacillus capparidis]
MSIFRKRMKIVALSFMALLVSVMPSLSVQAESSKVDESANCPTCGKALPNGEDLPDSKGSKEDISKAKQIVFSSKQFKATKKNEIQKVNQKLIRVEILEDGTGIVNIPSRESNKNLAVVQYGVDLKTKEIKLEKKIYVAHDNDKKNLKIVANGKTLTDFVVDRDHMITTSTGEKVTSKEFTKQLEESKSNGDVSTQGYGSCEVGVGLLCGATGFWACYYVCVWDAIKNFEMPELGCNFMCSLIFAVGCIEATDRICP